MHMPLQAGHMHPFNVEDIYTYSYIPVNFSFNIISLC